jgi:hypothetical protein
LNIWKRASKGAHVEVAPKGPLYRTAVEKSDALTRRQSQADVYRMTRRRTKAADIRTKIGNHTFRSTGMALSILIIKYCSP